MQTYSEVLDYLYSRLPMYQRVGASAFKKDLTNTWALCKELGEPQSRFASLHIAGTNGKGSTSNMLAAILQVAGYKTGLYTSPHLKDFRERIRIDGQMMPQQAVVDFVNLHKTIIEPISPSFFEVTVAMCFDFFARQQVDWAVIETGLGGRLDSTNVIVPRLSIVTNISWDHADMLGDTLEKIAFEKAGIIKAGVPVLISETQHEVEAVFLQKARAMGADIHFADQMVRLEKKEDGVDVYHQDHLYLPSVKPNLLGEYQHKNIVGVVAAAILLGLSPQAVRIGIEQVCKLTGLRGRWDVLSQNPLTVCDIAHNQAGICEVVAQIKSCTYQKLYIVLGMVADKDHDKILELLPKDAHYIFCSPNVPRGLNAEQLAQKAVKFGLVGQVEPSVKAAFERAKKQASPDDMIYVGGSTFVVAEVL